MKLLFCLFPLLCYTNLLLGQILIEWEKNYGGSEDDYFTCLTPTDDSGFLLGGTSTSNDGDVGANNGDKDFWLVKIDAWGAIVWEKNYGGSDYDWLNAIAPAHDGGFILGGQSVSVDGDVSDNNLTEGSLDYWLVKIDALGNIEWEQDYGGTAREYLYAIQATSDGGYISGGMNRAFFNEEAFGGNYGCWDFWVLKTDSIGNMEWLKNYGGTQCDGLQDLQETHDGGFILGGSVGSADKDVAVHNGLLDYWLVKIDAFGNIKWEQTYGESDKEEGINTLTQTHDGGFIFGGYSAPLSYTGEVDQDDKDIWLIKTDSLGNVAWEQTYGGSLYDELLDIQQLSDGGFILGARTASTDGDVRNNYGFWDYWIVKIDALGNIAWEKNYGGTAGESFVALEVINDGSFIIGGTSNSTDTDVSNNYGSRDFWIAKIVDTTINEIASSIREINPTTPSFEVYPNPNNGQFTIGSKNQVPFTLSIQNSVGQTILEKEGEGDFTQLNLMYQEEGVYFVTIRTKSSTFVRKIVLSNE